MSAEQVALQQDDVGVIVRIMLTFNRAATDFLGDCERRGFTPSTVVTYQRTYDQFAAFLPIDTDVSKITTDDLRRYLNTKSRLSEGTRAGIESHLASLFGWLVSQNPPKIVRNPMAPISRTRRLPSEDLDVVTVSTEDVRLMLAAAQGWTERLCMGVLVFTGCRRRAASRLRIRDYDELHRTLRFREKGGKTIVKPVADELDKLIQAAIAAGVYADDDYLIPSLGPRPHISRKNERSDRVIYDTVKKVAARAGVEAHVHAMRSGFIVRYLETHPGDQLGAQLLAGHRSPATTQIYQRKLDKQSQMERVRDMSWGDDLGTSAAENPNVPNSPSPVSAVGNAAAVESSQIADNRFHEDRLVGAGGFEPPEGEDPLHDRPLTEHLTDRAVEARDQAVSESSNPGACEPEAVQSTGGAEV